MKNLTPLERTRREYHRIDLPAEAYERILFRVLERTPAAAPSWLSGVAVGFAVGCAAIAALFAIDRQSRTGDSAAQNAAVVFDIRGIVGERASDTDELKRISVKHQVAAGAWLETHRAASLQVAIGPHRAQVGEDTRVRMESLAADHLAFSLVRGRLLFNVEPLPKGSKLAVRSGELVVEVVGTVFSVERNAECSAVRVIEGRVRTAFRGIADSVGAGEEKRYCEVLHAPDRTAEPASSAVAAPTSPSIPPLSQVGIAASSVAAASSIAANRAEPSSAEPSSAEPSSAEPSSAEPSSAEPSSAEPSSAEPSSAEATSSVSLGLTDEERSFRRGIETLKSGGSVNARASFQEYLRQYPNGTFSQDARFHLIRLVYAHGDSRQTVALGREFLRMSNDAGIRGNEVRLLVAQCLMQQGDANEEAYTLLEPLVRGASISREGNAEQIVYLYVLAAERTRRHGEARRWAAHYLSQYPTGRYLPEVTKIAGH